MNYISVELLKYASKIMAEIEQFKEEHPEMPAGLECDCQPDPGPRRAPSPLSTSCPTALACRRVAT
jgi:hypothetical protein